MEFNQYNTIYNVPAPMNHSSDKDEESQYEFDSDTSVYQLDKDTLDVRVNLASKVQTIFSIVKGQGNPLAFQYCINLSIFPL